MKQFLLAAFLISAVFAAPEKKTEVQSAQFMNQMMMMRNPMMRNPMFMGPINPMMMNPMMGCCSCMPRCPVVWMCPPVCNPCCCNNTCDQEDPAPVEEDIPDMHGPESIMPLPIFPNYPILDEIVQRILEKPVGEQYPPDIIVHVPRH